MAYWEPQVEELLALSEEEWERLNERLVHHALLKMIRLTWRGAYLRKGGTVPGAYEPQDFSLDAIRKMLDGTRPWNKEKYATVESALRASIDSDINHLVESIDNVQFKRLTSQSSKDETVKVYEIPGPELDPMQVVIDSDWRDKFCLAARKELAGEPQLAKLLDCYEDDCTAPAEISARLGITTKDVANLKKRLRRKLGQLDPRFKPVKERVAR